MPAPTMTTSTAVICHISQCGSSGCSSSSGLVLITVTATERPATDLGHLLHKHPDRAQSFPVTAGTAHVCYPRADEDECTAALLLEIDPIALVRGRRHGGFALAQYVNDRPYAAGSM